MTHPFRCVEIERMMRSIGRTFSVCLAVLAMLAAGCGKDSKSFSLRGAIQKLRSPSADEMVDMAFNPDDADRRREGITLLSKRDWGLQEPYLKHYAMVLDGDDDPSVRSAAARALGRAGDTKYLPNLINALDDKAVSVRWDAADGLDHLIGDSAADPLREHAIEDKSVDVRATCARALRHYGTAPVVRTLTDCLLDDDFTVRYRAHASLVTITGRDFGYDPEGWSNAPPSDRPTAEAKRRWWDWFGVSRRKKEASSRPADKVQPDQEVPSSTPLPPARR